MTIDLTGQTILLADDVAYTREIIVGLMWNMGNPTVHQARNGDEAARILENVEGISIIMSDFNMPGRNGLELLKDIRTGAFGLDRAVPFAMLTGYSDKNLVDLALSLDVNAFLIKPVSKKALTTRFEKLITQFDDVSWLKPQGVYDSVDIEGALEDIAGPPEEGTEPLVAAPTIGAAQVFGDAADETPAVIPGSPQDEPPVDAAAMIDQHMVMKRLGSLGDQFSDSELGGELADSTQNLVAEAGSKAAAQIIAVIDDFGRGDVMSQEDVLRVLRPPEGETVGASPPAMGGALGDERMFAVPHIPEGAYLARDLLTTDGRTLIRSGVCMTPHVVSILKQLDEFNVLSLERDYTEADPHLGLTVPTGLYLYAPREEPAVASELRFDAVSREETATPPASPPGSALSEKPPDVSPAPEMPPGHNLAAAEIPEGAILGKDLFMPDGRPLMKAGEELTPRMIDLLKDLQDLGLMDEGVLVSDAP